jgi:ubiquinone/menaquinone biosynthesis C-methylase UbiE
MTKVAEGNRLFYESAGVAERFRHETDLCPAEELILELVKDEIKDKPLLEIGVGAGRVTPYLTALTKDYVGIDCSRSMLDIARQKFPANEFLECAAEKLTMFEDQRFAAVVFWGNGIDEVEHEERIFIFKEINRVLRKGGVFLLSSHNFDWDGLINSAAFDELPLRRGVFRHFNSSLPRRLWIHFVCKVIYFYARFTQRGYAIFPHYEENITTTPILVYYISRDAQIKQLMNAGFEKVQAFTSGGVALNHREARMDYKSELDFELYYLAHRL